MQDQVGPSIVRRVAFARNFLSENGNAWIPGREEAIAKLADGQDAQRLRVLEGSGPSLASQVFTITGGPLDGQSAFSDHHPLHHILLFLALMRQVKGLVQSVHWNGVHFFLEDGELRAERSPRHDTS